MAPAVAGGVIAYEDLFEVIDQDPDGKKFDKVSRFRCRSQFEAELQIDINVDIYKLEVRSPFPSTRSRPPPPRSRRRASEPRGTREQRAARSSSLDSALVSLESPSSLTLAPSSPLTPHPFFLVLNVLF